MGVTILQLGHQLALQRVMSGILLLAERRIRVSSSSS